MHIEKVLNNNVVLASEGGRPFVLTGRGLGFQAKPGDLVDPSRIAQRFAAENGPRNQRLTEFLVDLPPEDVALAAEILRRASVALGTTLSPVNAIALADHLNFALHRQQSGQRVDYPLQVEVPYLFPTEHRLAQECLALIEDRTGVRLPDAEAVPIALHLVNAQFDTTNMAMSVAVAELLDRVFDVIDQVYSKSVDRSALSAARFVTHLRFLLVRLANGTEWQDQVDSLTTAIAERDPLAYSCALRVRDLLQLRLGGSVSEAEVAYLALHIARLTRGGA